MNQTTFKQALYDWLSKNIGVQHVFTIDFDIDFVTGNLIDGSFDAEAITQVPFNTDQSTTIQDLANEIQKRVKIFKATVTGQKQITCIGKLPGDDIIVVGPTVTGGVTQPVATISTVTPALSVNVIFADQAAPRPDYPYAVIRVNSIRRYGWDEMRSIDPVTNIANFGGQRGGTVSISYFGSNAFERISDAYNSLEKQTVTDSLYASGIAIFGKNDILNLTSVFETKFEERADFDFLIGFSENFEDDLGIIETAELTGTYEGAKNGDIIIGPQIIGV